MAGIKINFGEVESSFEPLPEGRYECIVETVEIRESKSSDNDYLNWELKVMDDEHEGRRLWMITSLSEKALFRLKDTFLALGVIEEDDEIDIEWEDDVDVTPQEGPVLTNPDVIGIACVAVVTNEVYDGRERNRVNEILDGNASTAAPTSSGRPAKAASRSRSSSKSSGNGKGAATKKPAAKRGSATKKAPAKAASGGRSRKLR